MKYQSKSFTVPTGSRKEENCEHGWTDTRGKCVLCGHVHVWGEEFREKVPDIASIIVGRDCTVSPCRARTIHYETDDDAPRVLYDV